MKFEIRDKVSLFFNLLKRRFNLSTSLGCRKEISKHFEWGDGYQVDDELSGLIEESGLEFLGCGASRMVLGYGDFAIKVEKWSDEEESGGEDLCSANLIEMECYYKFNRSKNLRLMVIPILDSFKVGGRLILVYPRLETFFYGAVEYSSERVSRDNEKKERVIIDRFVDGVGGYNTGYYKGEVFYIDYNIEYIDDYNKGEFRRNLKVWRRSLSRVNRSKRYIQEMRGMLR